MTRRPAIAFVRLDQIVEGIVSWLVPGFIPRGALTIVDGNPGVTKSMLTLTIAAYLTVGRPMPAGDPNPPAVVVIINPEDPQIVVQQRVLAAGGDPARVQLVVQAGPRSPRPYDLSRDLAKVRAICQRAEVELVIVDNLGLALGKAARTDDATRDVLYRLNHIAEQTGTAIIAVRHLTKNTRGNAIHAGAGRVALSGTARSVTLIAADPDDPNIRVWASVKHSFSAEPPSIAYEIADTPHGPAIEWLGTSKWCANDLLRTTTPKNAPKLAQAEQILLALLGDGPRLRNDIRAAVTAAGISWRTTQDAKANLNIHTRQTPEPGIQGAGPSWWSLPTTEERGQP